MTPEEAERIYASLTPEQREEVDKLLEEDMRAIIWRPQVGRQTEAAQSLADITGYGGAASGGKTDLAAGLTLTEHQRSVIFRREKAQTEGIVQRLTELIGSSDGYNSQKSIWKTTVANIPRLIEFGGLDNADDHLRWQGRPHDLIAVDEVTECREF
jgi:DNA-binding MarR family transcriptional regulator